MNNILTFKDGSDLDNLLGELWAANDFQPEWWTDFVKSLDDNIAKVDYNRITFIDEQSKMFFILKYS